MKIVGFVVERKNGKLEIRVWWPGPPDGESIQLPRWVRVVLVALAVTSLVSIILLGTVIAPEVIGDILRPLLGL